MEPIQANTVISELLYKFTHARILKNIDECDCAIALEIFNKIHLTQFEGKKNLTADEGQRFREISWSRITGLLCPQGFLRYHYHLAVGYLYDDSCDESLDNNNDPTERDCDFINWKFPQFNTSQETEQQEIPSVGFHGLIKELDFTW